MTHDEMAARLARLETQNRRLRRTGVAFLVVVAASWLVSAASSQTPPVPKLYSRVAVRVSYDANYPDWRRSIEQQIAQLPDYRLVSVTADARDNFWLFFESGAVEVAGDVVVSGGPVAVEGGPVTVRTP